MKFKKKIKIIYSLTILFVFLMVFLYKMGFRYNPTNSLPKGIYRITEKNPEEYKRGDLIMFCLPKAEAKKAKKRDYIPPGFVCPDGLVSLTKTVAGIFGDKIEIKNRTVHINGIAIKNGEVSKKDSWGRKLKSCGDLVVGNNEIFAMSMYNADSYDSRYFGVIHKNSIIGTAKRIWIWSSQKP